MVTKKAGLPDAPVARLAHVKDGFRVETKAVKRVVKVAEDQIKEIFDGALQFTEHRGGTMIMEKDVEAYLASTR